MRVNSPFVASLNTRIVVRFGFSVLLFATFFIASAFRKHSDIDLKSKQVNIIIRQIGHRLLLQAGDSTSRVMPVTQKQGTFLLTFEKEFVFSHDSLMLLSQQWLPKTQFPSGYTVTVHDCSKDEIVYGFQLNNTTPDILNCSGRTQPKGCYIIEFSFPDFFGDTKNNKAANGQLAKAVNYSAEQTTKTEFATNTPGSRERLKESVKVGSQKMDLQSAEKKGAFGFPAKSLVYTGILVMLCAVLLVGRFSKKVQPLPTENEKQAITNEPVSDFPALGKFLFDTKTQRLILGSEVISLTDKESRVLELLHKDFGELIPRDTLMQEVWINEGVITGRSLDMFISKLRKKLSADADLRITNVHGKGYRLELVNDFIA
jgi:hypothetical protein